MNGIFKFIQTNMTCLILILAMGFFFNCEDDNKPLAPYMGQRDLGEIQIEIGSFSPKITWVGGYSSVVAVNQDTVAKLDSTLIMLYYAAGNNIHYPVTFGQGPDGVQDIVSQYGGKAIDHLVEDNTYTFWVLKEDAWNEVIKYPGKPICVNSGLAASVVELKEDTVFVSASSFVQSVEPLDVFVNIKEAKPRGRLGTISIIQPTIEPEPVITWEVNPEFDDDKIAALGLCEGSSYSPTSAIWEVWSEEIESDKTVYGKKNVISSPIMMGETFEETKIFYIYPESGLERNKTYYFWIGNKDWDGLNHGRVVNNYANLTFQTY